MNNKLLLGLLGLILPLFGHGQFFSQYFDGADTIPGNAIFIQMDTSSSNVWQIGPPQKIIFNSAATVPNVIVTDTLKSYPHNNVSRFSFGLNTDFWEWGIFALQWMQKLDMDSDYDGGIVEVSVDTGNTWQNVFNNPFVYNLFGFLPANKDTLQNGEYAFSGTDTTWRDMWLCFDGSWLSQTDSILFRFTLKSDSADNEKEGWMIDNLMAHITFVHTIDKEEQEEYLSVLPNPTRGNVEIQARKTNGFHLIEHMELLDAAGKVVQRFGPSPTRFSLDIGHHPSGIYFLRITTNLRKETVKLILQRE